MAIKGGFWIHITCEQCGFVQEFTKPDKDAAIKAARDAGWNLTRKRNQFTGVYTGGELCKDCYKPIVTMADLRSERLAKRARGEAR